MNREQLIHGLRHLKVQTGSLACMGCQHEDNCGIKGCTILRAAIQEIEEWGKVKKQLGAAVNQQESDKRVHYLSPDELPKYCI